MKFTDSHCHLDFPELAKQQEELLKACVNKGIEKIIVPTVSDKNWQSVLSLSKKYATHRNEKENRNFPVIHTALGIHPWYVHQCSLDSLTALEQLVADQLTSTKALTNPTSTIQDLTKQSSVIAIGEAGLDLPMADKYQNLEQQRYFFTKQIAIAKQHKLPMIIHHRRTHNEIIEILTRERFDHGGVLHAFSGSYQQAIQYINMGFKLGIGGTITYARAKKTINAIKRLPLSALVLETDAPSMPLDGFQGQANSPVRLINVFDALVEIRSENAEEIASQIEININDAFNEKTKA